MTIKTTVTQEREVDIDLPFFRRDNTSSCLWVFAILNDHTAVSIFDGGGRTCVSVEPLNPSRNEVADKYLNWDPITEEQFLKFHSDALKSLSLEPVMA